MTEAKSIGARIAEHAKAIGGAGARGAAGGAAWIALIAMLLGAVQLVVVVPRRFWFGMGSLGISLVAAFVLGAWVAAQRGLSAAMAVALERSGIAERALKGLFEQVLDVRDGAEHGERGGTVAKTMERLPLAQAEQTLKSQWAALANKVGGAEDGVRKRILARVERAVLKNTYVVTLGQLRAEAAKHGGVDLVVVRETLVQRIDGELRLRCESIGRRAMLIAFAILLVLTIVGVGLGVSR